MRHLHWQALIAILGMALVGALLAGQGRSLGIQSEPAAGGVYVEALIGAPQRLNPLLDYANPVDRDIDRLIFSGLTRFDYQGKPIPDLANWNISEDQLTYTFIIKPTARWHDGQPVTTADVAFTLRLLQDPAYPGPADIGRLWQSVTVRAVNTQTIELTLPEPFAPFLDYTTFGLLPQHLLGDVSVASLSNADFNRRPIGSGPWQFKEWQVEDGQLTGVMLTSFADYYGPRPMLNEIHFRFYINAEAAWTAYRRGEVLGLSRLEAAQTKKALASAELGLYTSRLPQYTIIFLNLRNPDTPFFKDKKVRQALLRGLNRQKWALDLLHGQAQVAASPILPGSWANLPDLRPAPYDPATAASLLDSAGWFFPEGAVAGTDNYIRHKDGVPLRFSLITPDDTEHLALARAAQADWAPLGVQVVITPVAAIDVINLYLEPRAFQAVLTDVDFSRTPDPDPYPFWHDTQAESGQNYGGFSDRATSEYLEQARLTVNLGTRARLYQAFQARFADQTPAILLYYPAYNYAVDRKVGGVQIGLLTEPADRFNNLAEWYIVTRQVVIER